MTILSKLSKFLGTKARAEAFADVWRLMPWNWRKGFQGAGPDLVMMRYAIEDATARIEMLDSLSDFQHRALKAAAALLRERPTTDVPSHEMLCTAWLVEYGDFGGASDGKNQA
jgi:hypothetical protein